MPQLTYDFSEEGVTAALAALGDTALRVHETLAALGMPGIRHSGDACPIAVYLSAAIPTDRVGVESAAVSLVHNGGTEMINGMVVDVDGAWLVVDLPDPVIGFVSTFDAGDCPDLIAAVAS